MSALKRKKERLVCFIVRKILLISNLHQDETRSWRIENKKETKEYMHANSYQSED